MFEKIRSFLFKNKTDKQTVAKNTVWLSISNFGGRAIKAGVIIYAARVLGTAGYGVFSYVITLAGFFSFFVDPGVNNILMRETAKADEGRMRELFSTTFVIKLILVAATVLFIIFVAPLFSTLPGAKRLLPIAALIVATDPLRDFFSSLMRAREHMEWEAGVYILTNTGILIAGLAFLIISPTPGSLLWGYAIGTFIGAATAAWVVRDYLVGFISRASKRLIMPIMQAAWPFAVTSVLGTLLTSADIFIVSWMRSASDVGIYSAAIRIVQLFYLIPMIFQFSTLPLIARLANTDNDRFRAVLERTVATVFLISVPLSLGGFILGTQIMSFIFGAPFIPGGWAFKILMLTMLFDFSLAVISNAIFAYNRQRSLVVSAAIAGILNVILDLVFIPIFGITGSAIATLIAQTATTWYLWHTMNNISPFEVASRLPKIFTAGGGMALVVLALSFVHTNVVVSIFAGACVYLGLLYALHEPLLLEVKSIITPTAPEAILK